METKTGTRGKIHQSHTYIDKCVCGAVRGDWCFTSLSTIFQSYHDGGYLLHETRWRSGFKCCQHWCTVPQTQDTISPPSHIILTPDQPILVLSSERLARRLGEVNWCFTPFVSHVWLYMAVSFHSWRNTLFLGVNQQHSVSNWQQPLMGFEPQRRGASSFKARRLNHSAMEAPLARREPVPI